MTEIFAVLDFTQQAWVLQMGTDRLSWNVGNKPRI